LKYVFIQRQFESVLNSMYNMWINDFPKKYMSLDDFRNIKYSKLPFDPKVQRKAKYNDKGNKVEIRNSQFGWQWLIRINRTPREWYDYYNNYWHQQINMNTSFIHPVLYEQLIDPKLFREIMDKLSIFLIHKTKSTYAWSQITDKRIGIYPINYSDKI